MRTEEETGSEGEQTRQEGDEHGRGEQGGMDGRTMAAPRPGPPAPTWSASSLLMARASWSCSSSSPLLCGQACSASGGGPEPTAAEEAEGRGDTKAEAQGGWGEPLGPGVLPTAGQGGVQCAHIPAWPKASPAAQEQKSADRRGGPWEALSLCYGMRWGQGLPACLGRCSPVSVWGARGGGGAPSSRRSGVCSWALGRNSTCMPAHPGHGWGRENKRAET